MTRARYSLLLLATLALAGCDKLVHLDNHLEDGILLRAGFHPLPRVEAQSLAGLPPGTFVHQPDGRVLYADPDGCNCVYAGTEANVRAIPAQQQVLEQERDQSGGP